MGARGSTVMRPAPPTVPHDVEALRDIHDRFLSRMPLDRIIDALGKCADEWKTNRARIDEADRYTKGVFAPAHTMPGLEALFDSMTAERLWELVQSESVDNARGYPVIGHIISGTTPLLGFVSIVRALLVRSTSYVKLPVNASPWTSMLVRTLSDIDREIGHCIRLDQWGRGISERSTALCSAADLVVAYGSDRTIETLRSMRGDRPFLGYGHRLSIGLFLPDADLDRAADGFAVDTLLFDQGGCLSPQSIYVVGDAGIFAERLSIALADHAPSLPAERTEAIATSIAKAKSLARMDGCRIWEDPDLRWTVILRNNSVFAPSPTHGVISVQPLRSIDELPSALSSVSGVLQGCGVASTGPVPAGVDALLNSLGVSYVCEPGRMQCPPLSWPEDGKPVLRSLLS